jgi:predicted Zn-dependent peptidase
MYERGDQPMQDFSTYRESGISVHVMPTKQFKVNTVVVDFHRPLTAEMAASTAMLPYLLMRGTKTYRNTAALQRALDDLYGASLNGYVVKKGERQIMEFVLQVANERFMNGAGDLFDKALELLADVLFQPQIQNQAFDEESVQKEKQLHKERILSILDDKIAYAAERCLAEMCKGEPFGVPRLGTVEQLETLDSRDMYKAYETVLGQSDIHVYVIGQVEPDQVIQKVQSLFQRNPFSHRSPDFPAVKTRSTRGDIQKIVEEMDVNQGKLNIGYRTDTTHADPLYPAMVMYNGILGGFPHSKLFVNVREKASLAYYASSRLESLKGILYIQSGIEIQNFDKALSIIQEQVEAMKNGTISQQEFDFTRDGLLNQYRTLADQPIHIADVYTNGVISGKTRSLHELMEAIENVTLEQVVEFAQKVSLDTIYFLRDQGGN